MNFKEYVYFLSDKKRRELLNSISKLGDPNAILHDLFDTEPCYCQTKEIDVRVNERFLLWFKDKTFLSRRDWRLIKIDAVRFCYHSRNDQNDVNDIVLICNSGAHYTFSVGSREDATSIFTAISSYVKGFENIKPYSLEEKNVEKVLPAYAGGVYVFKNDTIQYRSVFFGHCKIKTISHNINNFIWCKQSHHYDPESNDAYVLEIYSEEGYNALSSDSIYNTFLLAIELKKRVPHLLYGPNKEYEMIYDKANIR